MDFGAEEGGAGKESYVDFDRRQRPYAPKGAQPLRWILGQKKAEPGRNPMWISTGDNALMPQKALKGGKKRRSHPMYMGRERKNASWCHPNSSAEVPSALLGLLLREGDRTRLRVRWWHCLRRSRLPGTLSTRQRRLAEVLLCRRGFRLLMSRLGGEWNHATPKRRICQAITGQRESGWGW